MEAELVRVDAVKQTLLNSSIQKFWCFLNLGNKKDGCVALTTLRLFLIGGDRRTGAEYIRRELCIRVTRLFT